jgi:RNA polymerase sigma-70 factor (ECF subfamily)
MNGPPAPDPSVNDAALTAEREMTFAGDVRDAAALAAPWHRSLHRFALALTGRDPEEAADVVQQTYLEVIEGRANLAGVADPRAYLFGVVRKVAASRRRRRWVHERLLGPLGFGASREPAAPRERGPEVETASGERAARVRQALARLKGRQLQAATLVFLEDMTVEQAGQAMGVSVGAARQHYHRAKLELARLLEDIDERR